MKQLLARGLALTKIEKLLTLSFSILCGIASTYCAGDAWDALHSPKLDFKNGSFFLCLTGVLFVIGTDEL